MRRLVMYIPFILILLVIINKVRNENLEALITLLLLTIALVLTFRLRRILNEIT